MVLGSYGATGLVRVLHGAVADKVLRHAHCPVLVARPRLKQGRILVATDFSDPALPAVQAAAEAARRSGAEITILHAIGDEVAVYHGGFAHGDYYAASLPTMKMVATTIRLPGRERASRVTEARLRG